MLSVLDLFRRLKASLTLRKRIGTIRDKMGQYALREFEDSDLPALELINRKLFFALLRHPDPKGKYSRELDEAGEGPRHFFRYAAGESITGWKRKDYWVAVTDPKTGALIGSIGVFNVDEKDKSIEIAYFIHPDYQNKGFATRATIDLITHLSIKQWITFDTIRAVVDPENAPSRRVLEKLNFAFEKDPKTGKEKIYENIYLGDPNKVPDHWTERTNGRTRQLKKRPRIHASTKLTDFIANAFRLEEKNMTPEQRRSDRWRLWKSKVAAQTQVSL